ncbi:hypothetical protein OTSTA763_1439 [Orientia tsutsugamushi str. TA763]|nr:hypothetical protein OTSTA763_1439 [Orientia tsutsugamushi str. TA763]
MLNIILLSRLICINLKKNKNKDEKINDIFMYPQNAAEVVVHESEFLFIASREEGNKVYLTVIGEHNTIQVKI